MSLLSPDSRMGYLAFWLEVIEKTHTKHGSSLVWFCPGSILSTAFALCDYATAVVWR